MPQVPGSSPGVPTYPIDGLPERVIAPPRPGIYQVLCGEVVQQAETSDLKSVQHGFESHLPYT